MRRWWKAQRIPKPLRIAMERDRKHPSKLGHIHIDVDSEVTAISMRIQNRYNRKKAPVAPPRRHNGQEQQKTLLRYRSDRKT